jgi:hypothetical protein
MYYVIDMSVTNKTKWIPYNPHTRVSDDVFLKVVIGKKEEVVIRSTTSMSGAKIVAWQPLPKDFFDDPTGWSTEFRGEIPPKNGWYVVQLVKAHSFRKSILPNITNLRFIEKEQSWAHLSDDYNVVAWREFPRL